MISFANSRYSIEKDIVGVFATLIWFISITNSQNSIENDIIGLFATSKVEMDIVGVLSAIFKMRIDKI